MRPILGDWRVWRRRPRRRHYKSTARAREKNVARASYDMVQLGRHAAAVSPTLLIRFVLNK
jgi:hypothetical protein